MFFDIWPTVTAVATVTVRPTLTARPTLTGSIGTPKVRIHFAKIKGL